MHALSALYTPLPTDRTPCSTPEHTLLPSSKSNGSQNHPSHIAHPLCPDSPSYRTRKLRNIWHAHYTASTMYTSVFFPTLTVILTTTKLTTYYLSLGTTRRSHAIPTRFLSETPMYYGVYTTPHHPTRNICTDGFTFVSKPSRVAYVFVTSDVHRNEYSLQGHTWAIPFCNNYLVELSALHRVLRSLPVTQTLSSAQTAKALTLLSAIF